MGANPWEYLRIPVHGYWAVVTTTHLPTLRCSAPKFVFGQCLLRPPTIGLSAKSSARVRDPAADNLVSHQDNLVSHQVIVMSLVSARHSSGSANLASHSPCVLVHRPHDTVRPQIFQ